MAQRTSALLLATLLMGHLDSLHGAQQYITGIGGNSAYGIYMVDVWAATDGVNFCFTNNAAYYQINNYNGTTSPKGKPYCSALSTITTYNSGTLQLNGVYHYAPLVDAAFIAEITDTMFRYLVNVGFNGISTIMVNLNINYASDDGAYTNKATNEVFVGTGGTKFYPLAACHDVVAHELAHIHVNRYSNLPSFGQGGCINEAYCDMAGIASKYFLSGIADFKFATTCLKNKTLVAARWLCNPEKDGGITHVSQWFSGMNVYKGSGVFRKAFCLAATCTTATTGILQTFKTFATANMIYWNSTSNFNTAACGVRKAAAVVFTQPAEITCFVNAFAAVGITIPPTCV